ncbi:MAG TPA: hypothetical protein VEG33_22620, partial [Streptosporangiaceae bacterium]|nr:hypothetical protein [Streptosporangiaceae bacterium]
QLLTLVVPVARQILLQVACGDIGQLTDFEAVTMTSESARAPEGGGRCSGLALVAGAGLPARR